MGRAKTAGIAGPDRRSPGIDLHCQIVCGILQERGIATDSSHYYEWYAIQLHLGGVPRYRAGTKYAFSEEWASSSTCARRGFLAAALVKSFSED